MTKDYYTRYAAAVINYLLTREHAIKRIIDSPARSAFVDVFMYQNYKDTKRRLEASAAAGMSLPAPADVVASMLIGGTSHCIVSWFIADKKPCTAEKLLADISKLIDKILN